VFPFGYGPAANLRAPMVDLLAFAGSLFRGPHRHGPQLLASADWEQMWTPVEGSCGLGFFVRRDGEVLSVGHGGAVYGFATQLEVLPDEGLAVAAGCNLDMGNAVVRAVVEQAIALLRARRAEESVAAVARPQPLGVDAARAMEGVYRSGGDRVELLARGDELVLVPDLGTAVRIRVLGDELVTDDRTSMRVPLAGAGWRGSDRAELAWRGRAWRRDADASALPPPAPEALRPYLGEYGWDHNRLVVFERDGALATLVEWLVYCPVAATPEPGVFRLDDRSMYSGELLRFVPAATGAEGLWLGGCWLPRVADHEPDTSFRIRPLHDAASLRRLAAQARAPRPPADALPSDLVELAELDPSLRYDVRYATDNNFMGMAFYERPAVRLQRPAARALIECQRRLAAAGLGLVLYDGYRPWTVTKMFFDATPVAQRMFVADPANGSRHNRGCAIDLGLVDRRSGEVLPMVSGYDEFSPKASPDYPGSTSRRRALRELLRRTMEQQGFEVYEHEWWHFDYRDWGRYPVLDER